VHLWRIEHSTHMGSPFIVRLAGAWASNVDATSLDTRAITWGGQGVKGTEGVRGLRGELKANISKQCTIPMAAATTQNRLRKRKSVKQIYWGKNVQCCKIKNNTSIQFEVIIKYNNLNDLIKYNITKIFLILFNRKYKIQKIYFLRCVLFLYPCYNVVSSGVHK